MHESLFFTKLDPVRLEGESHDSFGLVSAAGVVNARDELAERQCFFPLRCLHAVIIGRATARALLGVYPIPEVRGKAGFPDTRRGRGLELNSECRRRPRRSLPGLSHGQLDTAFDAARRDDVAGETCNVVDVELLHEALPVFLDCLNADAQFRCDLFVGLAFGNQLEHLRFARTQAGFLLLSLFPWIR